MAKFKRGDPYCTAVGQNTLSVNGHQHDQRNMHKEKC